MGDDDQDGGRHKAEREGGSAGESRGEGLEEQGDDAGGQAGDEDEKESLSPIFPEEGGYVAAQTLEGGEQGAEVQADIEEEVGGADPEFFEEQEVSRRGDGQEFGQPLHDAEDEGLKDAHFHPFAAEGAESFTNRRVCSIIDRVYCVRGAGMPRAREVDMKLGVVGLPNVGKSTLFNAITKAGAQAANYAFCTIEPNVGVVAVPDERLEKLAALYDSKKVTPTTLEFVDIAGLVRGASRGEGLGNKFLSHIREVDAIVEVVRCFDDENIIHVDGGVDPVRDMETIGLELVFADIETVERRLGKAESMLKADKKYAVDVERLKKMKAWLEEGRPLRSLPVDEEFSAFIAEQFLLTAKPVIYVANVDEAGLSGNAYTEKVRLAAESEGAECIVLSAKLEEDLGSLDEEDRAMFMEEYGLKESGLDKLVKASYKLLGLISYLTAGEKETRAWTIKAGTKAPAAAGKIHSDFEKGFIRAEIVDYETLLECGSFAAAKEKGKVRSEGKDYVMRENDVVLFRFNV